ncbi:phage tail sheath C-terminal domain-containing protein [Geobacillus stearothermophilus]|uniref:phage tail sheath C-terminal domain-containing protein n=1 Tax=Geobacillus stearothermophilus TaxID=1422 RepID=UPI0005196AD9|nr:phage tail sheath C-terminal domain-containing protein [Geobacillus stearothermophilus]MED4333325.1 phage tail sheath C-terminal domain-containing protein [Geobacillus stearothermophilus]MED4995882.1 phage tail sheath C-terminal domain-containing protein [Geobacillus stearothermophilus]
MAGGTWETQNKIRPGAYINFETNSLNTTTPDSNTVVAIPLKLDWGETRKFVKVTPNTKFKEVLGKDLNSIVPIREAFKATGQVLIFNLNSGGNKATATGGGLTATAKYVGSDGNKLSVVVTVNLDGTATVRTYFDGAVVDTQTVATIADLQPNAFVTFSGQLPTVDVTLTLSGGTTGTATNDAYSEFAAGLDTQDFKVVAVGTDDSTVKALLALKVKEWRANYGKNVTLVTNNYNEADHEGVVSVLNGVTLEGGEQLTAKDALYWYAAAYANAGTSSLTYAEYPGAVDCERKTHEEIEQALKDGHIVYTFNRDSVVVEQDINTFRSFTPTKNQDFRKNKIIREMDIVSDNTQYIYSKYFIGKVSNNDDGRNLFKKEIMKTVLDPLVRAGALEPYNPDEIVVQQGDEKDAVLVNAGLKFVDAMEKLYMTVACK